MDSKLFIYAGGVYHVSWAVFDSFWPVIFQWKKRLSGLDDLNRVLPYITSRLLIVLYLMLAYISFIHTSDLLETRLGRTVLIGVSSTGQRDLSCKFSLPVLRKWMPFICE